jgi:transposase
VRNHDPRRRSARRPERLAPIEDAESEIPDSLRHALAEICTEVRQLDQRVTMTETRLAALADQIPGVARPTTIPGIGLITATGLAAFIDDINRFPSARHLASHLGLTPQERSTGEIA